MFVWVDQSISLLLHKDSCLYNSPTPHSLQELCTQTGQCYGLRLCTEIELLNFQISWFCTCPSCSWFQYFKGWKVLVFWHVNCYSIRSLTAVLYGKAGLYIRKLKVSNLIHSSVLLRKFTPQKYPFPGFCWTVAKMQITRDLTRALNAATCKIYTLYKIHKIVGHPYSAALRD